MDASGDKEIADAILAMVVGDAPLRALLHPVPYRAEFPSGGMVSITAEAAIALGRDASATLAAAMPQARAGELVTIGMPA